jgi:thiol-disulfide isomerase/thioredoxin
MKKFYSLLVAIAITANSFAQVSFAVGATVPNFTVTDLNGVEHTLYDYTAQGKFVLVDFYAYWCGPCMTYAPYVNDFYHKYGCNNSNVIVIGVEYEGTEDQCHSFENSAGIANDNPFPACSGTTGGGGAVHATYGASAYPTYISISPENTLLDNDIWPLGADPVATLEAAFPAGSLVEMECAVSVKENQSENTFTLAPNPASSFTVINAQLASDCNQAVINVYDGTGKLVMSENWKNASAGQNRMELNTSALSSGLYTIQLANGNSHIQQQRLLIQ